jgi:hypothetical protein
LGDGATNALGYFLLALEYLRNGTTLPARQLEDAILYLNRLSLIPNFKIEHELLHTYYTDNVTKDYADVWALQYLSQIITQVVLVS